MLNLLIREDRYYIRGEYLNRVFNLFLTISIFLGFIYLGILNAVHMSVKLEYENLLTQSEKIKNSDLSQKYAEYTNLVNEIEKEYELLNKNEYLNLLAYIQQIEENLIPEINVNFLNITEFLNEKEEKEIIAEIRGNSANRDVLLAFSKRLEDLVGKENIEVPISNFVQSQDSAFSIKIKFIK
jgi:hypothetical protein